MQKLNDYDYTLPEHLIARYPLPERSGSRLLVLDRQEGGLGHYQFTDLLDFLSPNDLLVFNDTRVIPARLFGNKSSGGKIEILIERILSDRQALAHVRSNKKLRMGAIIHLSEEVTVKVIDRQGDLFILEFTAAQTLLQILNKLGEIPLPQYFDRKPEAEDLERYQTIYATRDGAVAAPTAGLHFDQTLMDAIKAKNIPIAYVTLHVGAGTFQPVRVEDITQHKMHAEYIQINADVCGQINDCKKRKGKIVAVGTTTVRVLETAARAGYIQPYSGETEIFIYGDYKFNCVDAMITNFHLPKSTLLMLVSAFAGYKNMLMAYQIAIQENYRFYSYGDAMLIL